MSSTEVEKKLLNEFEEFSQMSRKRFKVSEDVFWELEKLYIVLQDHQGGFLIDIGKHTCLGLQVEDNGNGNYLVTYRDPFYPDFKQIKINSRILQTDSEKKIKIQWFGKFEAFKEKKVYPSFSKLTTFRYRLCLPAGQEKLLQRTSYQCGDISAFLADRSKVIFEKKLEFNGINPK
jgi:hypothetical protein